MINNSKISGIVNLIASKFDPDKIILFGSYATNNQNKDSDLDLIIVKDTNLPTHLRSNDIRIHLIGSLIPMDILVYTNEEYENEKDQKFSFLHNVLKGAQILYERKN